MARQRCPGCGALRHQHTVELIVERQIDLIRRAGLDPVDRKGMVFNPVSWRWSLSDRDLSVNYVTASVKRA